MKIGDTCVFWNDGKYNERVMGILARVEDSREKGKFYCTARGWFDNCRLATDEENPDFQGCPVPDDRVVGDWYFVWGVGERPTLPYVRQYAGNGMFYYDGDSSDRFKYLHWERLVQS